MIQLPASDAALIVGGTSGVGLETAVQLAQAGLSRIAIVGRNADRGNRALALISARAPDCALHFIRGDANDPEQAKRIAAEAERKLGQVDILINCTVGPFAPTLFHDIPIEDLIPLVIQQMMGPILMCRAVLPGMRTRRKGIIVNVASDAAKVPTVGEAAIGGAMAGITMFSRTLAMEAKRDGIRVNAVTPSIIEGTMSYERGIGSEHGSRVLGKAAKLAHLGVAQPADLAGLILYLVSPAAERLTGQVISLNGGISAG
jgi:NAD(P)-dependent dehydrogenase (short-subunit alcohol dehydrogenase family)